MAELFRYAAFISYASEDAFFAQRLHRALERYTVPSSLGKFDPTGSGKKNRIYPVFRDREELSAGQLGPQIEANLKTSAALIVVCSPSSAASAWVQKEIEYFAALRPNKIFAIISDTVLLVDEAGRDCLSTCFPPAFRGDALQGDPLEPLAADSRKGRDGFRKAWLKIVAGMIGVSPGQIIDRDKTRRTQQLSLSVLALLAFAALSARGLSEVLRYAPHLEAAAAGSPLIVSSVNALIRDHELALENSLSAEFKSVFTREHTSTDSWLAGQIISASRDPRFSAEFVRGYFDGVFSPSCACWAQPVNVYGSDMHGGAVAWDILALSHKAREVSSSTFSKLLDRQGADGAWPLYFDADIEDVGSSYATAVIVYALHRALLGNTVPANLRDRSLRAVRKGKEWLLAHAPRADDLWTDYPDDPVSVVRSRGLSALTVFVLLATADDQVTAALVPGQNWFRHLSEPARFDAIDVSNRIVPLQGGQSRRDATSYPIFGWELFAIKQIYPQLGPIDRIRARRYIFDAVRGWPIQETPRNAFISAELLYALRQVDEIGPATR